MSAIRVAAVLRRSCTVQFLTPQTTSSAALLLLQAPSPLEPTPKTRSR
jgi:Protein of unknown function (DUF1214)